YSRRRNSVVRWYRSASARVSLTSGWRGRRGGRSRSSATLERLVRIITSCVSARSASGSRGWRWSPDTRCAPLNSCQVPSWPGRSLEALEELLRELSLPLAHQGRGREDEGAAREPPDRQLFVDDARLDRLTQPHLVGEDGAPAHVAQHALSHVDLVGQLLDRVGIECDQPVEARHQRDALRLAPPGPVLVIAGPGAGKTFCLIARINQLVEARGVAPERICAVTFTNRAAEEIAIRLKHTLRDRADVITRGTIHALCLSLLREHAEAAGLRKGFGVADEQYQKVVLGRLHVPLEQRGSLLNRFSRHRVRKQDFELTHDDARLYREYAAWLAHRNMLDFDDLVTQAEELLRTRGDIADTIAARWDHRLVDEFHDVNAVQYDLLKRLAAPHDILFAVGDDEQSIFTWTGADPYVLVRFARDYGIERPIVLDKNCRCSRQIFETARRVLAQNPQLFEKQLSAEQESPYEVVAYAFRDEAEEASWLLEDLRSEGAAARLGWGDYAILYRRHKIGEYVEGRLVRAGIPCRLARGRSLVEDDVIKYVIAALRIVRDPSDPVALEAFARCVLSPHFLQEVMAATSASSPADEFLATVRALARRRPAQHPDTKKLWRLVYQV